MRWSTLVVPVTLFYSLSLVYAIPHDADEKRQWLDKRQASSLSPSSSPVSDVAHSSSSGGAGSSSSPASPTLSQDTPNPSSSLSSSTQGLPTSTPSPSSGPSSTNSDSSSSTSSSSSSSSSSSGTRSSTSSPSSPTITNDPVQGSTSYRRFTSTRDLPNDTSSTDGSVQTGSGSGSSFLKNKAAMGSTFAIVGLVGVAIIIGATLFVLKKVRKHKDEEELDNYFEKLPPSNANNQHTSGNDYGLGPSATDLTSPANDQAYLSRDVHYGATGQYPSQYANYNGFEYPPERGSVVEYPASYAPGTAYAAAMNQPGQYRYEGQAEDPNVVPNHPFADPDNRRY